MSSWSRMSMILERMRNEGAHGTAQRVARRVSARLGSGELDFPLHDRDIADSLALDLADGRRVEAGAALRIGWVCTPPGRNSGGHTTMFRMVRAFEDAGHRCEILLYDRHGGALEEHQGVIRGSWPWVSAKVRSVDDGLERLDVCFASSWPTAHVLASRGGAPLHRFYLVQDYEPFFYPRGSEHALAEDTYRFGFANVALGEMVRSRLRSEAGVDAHLIPFGCDRDVYRLQNSGPRSGIVVYAKPEVPRRGYRLVTMALRAFHERHPEQEIHVYGQHAPNLGVPVTHHGHLAPVELCELYNRVIAGVALSFTNISLVADEMLAAGCVPVVNDDHDPRLDEPNPLVKWARPTAIGLADALADLVTAGADGALGRAAASSLTTADWDASARALVRIVEGRVRGEAASASGHGTESKVAP